MDPGAAAVVTTTEQGTSGQIALRTQSHWPTQAVEVELLLEAAYHNIDQGGLVCLLCQCSISGPEWQTGACRCPGLDLLIKPKVLTGTVPCVHRDGKRTTFYCQVERNRADGLDNSWLSKHVASNPKSGRALALKLTEIVRQKGQKARTTVHSGFVRIYGKTAIWADELKKKVRTSGKCLKQAKTGDQAAAAAATLLSLGGRA